MQAWAADPELQGDPVWTRQILHYRGWEKDSGSEDQAGGHGTGSLDPTLLPLVPEPGWYVSPRQPFSQPLSPELKARQLVLGAEHALLLGGMGQMYTWGTGR